VYQSMPENDKTRIAWVALLLPIVSSTETRGALCVTALERVNAMKPTLAAAQILLLVAVAATDSYCVLLHWIKGVHVRPDPRTDERFRMPLQFYTLSS
jgi:hypothetical protein